jgi:hypothetical protein
VEKDEPNLHRNNAAEWVMVAFVLPFVLLRAFVSSYFKRMK